MSRSATAAAALALALALAGCTGTGDGATADAPDATPGGAPVATSTPPVEEPSTEDGSTGTTAPATFGETFDLTGFSGLPVGTTLADFAAASGWTQDGCSAPGNALFTPAATSAEADWVLYAPAYENEADPDADPQTWGIDEFALQLPDRAATGRVGPVGPEGIQLGATTADVDAAFPDASRTEWASEATDVVYDERIVTAPDGRAMVVALVDGVVVDIRWGSPDLAEGFTSVYCF